MKTTAAQRATILALVAIAIVTTRLHHFAAVPDASWAMFFVGGFYLRQWTRWAFPALMALAVLVDVLVIRAQGGDFWQSYCVSPAYWCLVPAHFALWAGGAWLQRSYRGIGWRDAANCALALVASVVVCHLLAQGSFYWFSGAVGAPAVAGWWQNYLDWLPPYLAVASGYVAIAAMAHVFATRAGVLASPRAQAA
jgi:hypothetical protein